MAINFRTRQFLGQGFGQNWTIPMTYFDLKKVRVLVSMGVVGAAAPTDFQKD